MNSMNDLQIKPKKKRPPRTTHRQKTGRPVPKGLTPWKPGVSGNPHGSSGPRFSTLCKIIGEKPVPEVFMKKLKQRWPGFYDHMTFEEALALVIRYQSLNGDHLSIERLLGKVTDKLNIEGGINDKIDITVKFVNPQVQEPKIETNLKEVEGEDNEIIKN